MNRTAAEPAAIALPRKASREHRRQQLIDATIESLARRGYAQTTMTDVAVTAGVSHGLVNFHFDTKEKLLTETLLYLAEEYRDNWLAALAAAPADPAAQLDALIVADFNERICTPSKLVAWCAFWAEAQSRPIYQEKCGANDLAYIRNLEEICARLVAAGNYRHSPQRVARVLRVTAEGTWLDLLSMIEPYSRDEALRTVYACAAAFFPDHFDEAGLRKPSVDN
ncbi:MAG: TetR/AcrR family transcriptional regulator [Rhizobiales bacterium]|nr:TetR/AcrR family transcriptional regulator [Hyphomicrobiales bacterium]MBI3672453.1 TetR/AcrR family transcriptional regulator [Hyphomicrobiales bacterium]